MPTMDCQEPAARARQVHRHAAPVLHRGLAGDLQQAFRVALRRVPRHDDAAAAPAGGRVGFGAGEQARQVALDPLDLVLRVHEEDGVLRQGRVPAGARHQGRHPVRPNAQLAARGLAHGGISQVHREVGPGDRAVQFGLRDETVRLDQVPDPQRRDEAPRFLLVVHLPVDVHAERVPLGHLRQGAQQAGQPPVEAEEAEQHEAARPLMGLGRGRLLHPGEVQRQTQVVHGQPRARFQRPRAVGGVAHHGGGAFGGGEGEGEAGRQLPGADFPGQEAFALFQARRAVVPAHRGQVPGPPAVVEGEAGEEVLQDGVVQDRHAGQDARHAEDVGVQPGVVADVEEGRGRVVSSLQGGASGR
jgi:hypothetical protein